MDKNCTVIVTDMSGNSLLNVKGTLDTFSAGDSKRPADFAVKLNDIEYPSMNIMWAEVRNGNTVTQAQVKVEYISKICSTYTKLRAIEGTIRTFDARYDCDIPCGPRCSNGHAR